MDDRAVKVCDTESGKELATLRSRSESITSVAFSPAGERIVSGSRGVLKVWKFDK